MTPALPPHRLYWLLSVSLFLLPATLVGVKGGYGIAAMLPLLISLACLVPLIRSRAVKWSEVRRDTAPIWVPFLCFFLAFLLSVVMTGDSMRGLDYPNRWLLLMPIVFVLVAARRHIDFKYFWLGIAVGSLLTGIVSTYQIFGLGYGRSQGFTAANPYGNLSILLGLLCGVGALYAKSRKVGIILALAGWGGMWASLLSVTRGGWPLLVPFVILLLLHLARLPRKTAVMLLVAHIVLVTLAFPTASRVISNRIDDASRDLSIADPQKKSESSVGARLAMWKISFQIWQEHPAFGIGPTRYKDELHRKNTEQFKSSDIYTQNVAHHEWLDAMARAGTVGGLALALVYVLPLAGLLRRRHTRPALRSLGGAGVVAIIGSFGLYGLTNTTFTNHPSLLFFIVALSVVWAQYLQETDADPATQSWPLLGRRVT
ncbi:hypothetical protein GCM10007242_17680 [Pigmentiphaga litoralis]|uniref:O-antigen ligase family protein n=1 Tax=Pigmentiphaga litoralis TaxID=516702 RepID=UPI0016723596|nr:O-antigen ligase family protein [Pigmentiphaga litoralis]GGX11949.1 hypothetical protein GCM10007242_17680 [Pigmentiphaga litoralis]